MTVTDFSLMAVLVVVITLGLIRASGAKGYFERGIFTLGGVVMTIISACLREEVKVDTLPNGNYAVQKLPNSLDYVVTEVSSGADKALYKLDQVDTPATGLDQDLDLEVYPGLLKYLSQAAELAPLLDFWEELRVIRGGLL